jgi:hypothetical protein
LMRNPETQNYVDLVSQLYDVYRTGFSARSSSASSRAGAVVSAKRVQLTLRGSSKAVPTSQGGNIESIGILSTRIQSLSD